MVMDYLDGECLAQVISREGFLDVERSLEIFLSVAEALEHAHWKGVIHRDLKPSNFIPTKTENGSDFAKIVDFGIAKILPTGDQLTQQLTQTGETFGSPFYMSPEQCKGDQLDFRSDIYSFGCVMFETLTGKPPFSGQNPVKTILKHLTKTPPELTNFVLRCIES